MYTNPKQDHVNLSRPVTLTLFAKGLLFWHSLEKTLHTQWAGWLKQLLRFGVVGVLNTLVDAGVYFLLSRSGMIPDLVLAKGLSYSLGVLNSFFWNKSWTFQSRVNPRRVFLPFVVANLLAVGLNTWMMHLALASIGLPESGALILATTVTFVWNFIVNKFYVFK